MRYLLALRSYFSITKLPFAMKKSINHNTVLQQNNFEIFSQLVHVTYAILPLNENITSNLNHHISILLYWFCLFPISIGNQKITFWKEWISVIQLETANVLWGDKFKNGNCLHLNHFNFYEFLLFWVVTFQLCLKISLCSKI